ncbi:hypothetical protein BC567DRAFT_29565 [Phyllosticta citribraziliensis]
MNPSAAQKENGPPSPGHRCLSLLGCWYLVAMVICTAANSLSPSAAWKTTTTTTIARNCLLFAFNVLVLLASIHDCPPPTRNPSVNLQLRAAVLPRSQPSATSGGAS